MPLPNDSSAGDPAVFFDRDGTLMRDVEYCGRPGQVEIFPDVPAALRRLKTAGFQIFVITNQSGIGRGYFSEEDYRAVEAEVEKQVGAGLIDGTYFCPDHPDAASSRRKPEPGMIMEAQRDHGLDLSRSFMVGDKSIDMESGRKASLRTILVHTGIVKQNDVSGADWEARDLTEAVEIILRHAT